MENGLRNHSTNKRFWEGVFFMVSTRQSRIWGINKICSVCYKSFLARNPKIKRCDECRKEDYFDDNTAITDGDSIISPVHNKKLSIFISTVCDVLYKEAEEKLSSNITRTEHLSLDKLSDSIRKELWN